MWFYGGIVLCMWPTAKLSITGLAKHTTPSLATRPLKMVYQQGEGVGMWCARKSRKLRCVVQFIFQLERIQLIKPNLFIYCAQKLTVCYSI